MPKLTLDQKIAITIQYDQDTMKSPTVTAKGFGHQAEQIIKIAKENNIPLQQNLPLIELLSQVEIDEQIPEVLYEAIAQVLIFAYKLSDKPPSLNN